MIDPHFGRGWRFKLVRGRRWSSPQPVLLQFSPKSLRVEAGHRRLASPMRKRPNDDPLTWLVQNVPRGILPRAVRYGGACGIYAQCQGRGQTPRVWPCLPCGRGTKARLGHKTCQGHFWQRSPPNNTTTVTLGHFPCATPPQRRGWLHLVGHN